MLFSKSRIKNLDKTDFKIREAVDRLTMNGNNTFKTVSSRASTDINLNTVGLVTVIPEFYTDLFSSLNVKTDNLNFHFE